MTRVLMVVLALVVGNDSGNLFRSASAKKIPGIISGTITGRVLSGTSPVARVLVTAELGDGSRPAQALTDDDGRYELAGLAPGRYLLTAARAGWLTTHYGSPRAGRPPGSRVAVADGARVNIDIPIVRGGVIAGRIVDEAGNPMSRVWPWLLEERVVGDRRVIARATTQDVGSFERATDDRGEFRLFGLPPGTYYLVVTPSIASGARLTTESEVRWAEKPAAEAGAAPSAGPVAGYAPYFFPGTPDPSAAQGIELGPGQVREGLTWRVGFVSVARVAGTVTRSDGAPLGQTTIELVPRQSRALLEGSRRTTSLTRDGTFAFQNVPPGEYTVRVRAASAATPAAPPAPPAGAPPGRPQPPRATVFDLWGETDINVSGQDIDNVAISLLPAASISGRLAFLPGTSKPPADLTLIRLQFIPTEAVAGAAVAAGSLTAGSTATVDADGTYRVQGLAPDRYAVIASWPGMRTGDGLTGWWITNVRVGDRDLGDAPIDVAANAAVPDVTITFSDRIGAIEGSLTDAANRPAPEYLVIVFPVERSSWSTTSRRILSPVKPGTDGRFRIPGVLPGDYYLAVVTTIGQEEPADPAFLEAVLPSAIKVTVGAGETRRQDLRIK